MRYLVDAQGNPFLIKGDTAWSLLVQLTDSEVDTYLDDRQAKGFNTILVNLIEHKFADQAPNTISGIAPFTTAGHFSTRNDAYFDHAATVIQKAASRGILVLLAPAYLGANAGNEGWYADMVNNNTTSQLREYGRYLANTLSGFNNIIWVHGGDYTPADLSVVNAVAEGIRDVGNTLPFTYHGDRDMTALESAGGSLSLSVNNVYTYDSDVSLRVYDAYTTSTMPLFLIESTYESEHNVSTQTLRAHAYQALLNGAAGEVFGNNPIWHFDAPDPLFGYTGTWQTALNSAGSMSMQRLHALWDSFNWWRLQPNDGMVSTGHAALASNGSFAVAYVTASVTVDMSVISGPNIHAQWFNPYSGTYTDLGTFGAAGSQIFTRPNNGNNGNGSDWILLLQSEESP